MSDILVSGAWLWRVVVVGTLGGGILVVEGAGGCGAGVEAWWRWGGVVVW